MIRDFLPRTILPVFALAAIFFTLPACDRKPLEEEPASPPATATTSPSTPDTTADANPETPPPSDNALTWAAVRQHNSQSSCWIVIDQNVYNVTPFFEDHPGGVDALLEFCGKDASNAFNNKPHSNYARHLRERYLLGPLT
jgi:cytochrome b involved in lipid metabolism